MPELPEVETMRRGIASVAGCTIRDCRRPRSRLQSIIITPSLKSIRRRVIGRKITTVGRVGKRIVLELDSLDRIVIEPRMSGAVILADPRDQAHLRLVFELSGPAKQLLFWDQRGLGVVRLVSPAEFDLHYGPHKIGPDALVISVAQLRERLGESRRAIKVALLDQKALAGIGNIYASEILHRIGVHPETPCDKLTPRQWTRLHAEMGHVLQEALHHQGSTLADNVYTTPEGEPGKYAFRVYQRHGEPCQSCGRAAIERIVQAQRSTFFCPACQASPCAAALRKVKKVGGRAASRKSAGKLRQRG
jgi:formamidopyrimidine-DNA glycosylase